MQQPWRYNIRLVLGIIAAIDTVFLPIPSMAGTECTFTANELISGDELTECFVAKDPSLADVIIGTWTTECWDGDNTNATVDDPSDGTLTVTSLTSITYSNDARNSTDGCIFGDQLDFDSGIFSATFSTIKILGTKSMIALYSYRTSRETVDALETWHAIELKQNSVLLASDNATVRLTRVDTRPEIPTSVSAAASGTTVTVSWTDASSDETSFRILRKDSVTGTYAEVGTAASGATSYSETVSAGTYWYRVRAVNGNGDSLGSNVVKVTVE